MACRAMEYPDATQALLEATELLFRSSLWSRTALVVAAAVLTGCNAGLHSGFTPAGIAPADVASSDRPTGVRVDPDGSWMLPEATKTTLVYVSGWLSTVPNDLGNRLFVFSYPAGRFEGIVADGLQYGIDGLCTDASGNVFVAAQTSQGGSGVIQEFAHGGKHPVRTVSQPGTAVYFDHCSVDPASGDLAFASETNGVAPNVSIYPKADLTGMPRTFNVTPPPSDSGAPDMFVPTTVAYDGEGNLFVGGKDITSQAVPLWQIFELPKHGTTFEHITALKFGKGVKHVGKAPAGVCCGFFIGGIGKMAWDGKYMTFTNDGCHAVPSGSAGTPDCPGSTSYASVMYRVQVTGSVATIVGTTALQPVPNALTGGSLSFRTGKAASQANVVIAASFLCATMSFWSYPAGGSPLKTLNVPPSLNGACYPGEGVQGVPFAELRDTVVSEAN